jgi:hypothetical protein
VPTSVRTTTCVGGKPSRSEPDQRPCELTVENGLAEGVVQEGILHIELLNWPVTGDSNSEHHADDGRFNNRDERLVVVNPGVLSEPQRTHRAL